MYSKILDKNQKSLINKTAFLNKYNFYLAGGTALALYLGHRTSLDYDFYTKKEFDSQKLIEEIKEKFKKLENISVEKNTLLIDINKVHFSFFHYQYKLLAKHQSFKTIKLASLKDIAAMKIIAIVQRGTKRDFIDIYFLLKKFSLKEIISWTLEKYTGYNQTHILKALIYFKDAENEKYKRLIKVFDKSVTWKKVKKNLLQIVKKYQLAMFKK